MAIIAPIGEFKPEEEQISTYLERVQLFFVANSIAEEKQVVVLLSAVGAKTYALLRDLLAPTKPQEKTIAELSSTLTRHYEPKPIVITKHFHFHRRNQASGESVAEYVVELRRLATHCQFGEYLDEALRDRLVCGMRNTATQKRLLSEPELSLKRLSNCHKPMKPQTRMPKRCKRHKQSQFNKCQTLRPRSPVTVAETDSINQVSAITRTLYVINVRRRVT